MHTYYPLGAGTGVVHFLLADSYSELLDCCRPRHNPFESIWSLAPLRSSSGGAELLVDLARVNGTLLAVRYGWGGRSGDTCCNGQGAAAGLEVCRPAACPIMTANTSLPANPFFATFESGKCVCAPPQKCDE